MKKLLTLLAISICLNANAHKLDGKLNPLQDTVNFNNYKEMSNSLNFTNNTKKQDFLGDVFSFILNLFLPSHGKYNEVSRQMPPYTFFDNGDISGLRTDIRDNILSPQSLASR